ncbi:MAG TPA: hypothetical protein VKH81_17860 [Candidatus Angelobacter sp.]|nr:hypothetical protein [Candidatus Angelobacter sp.]
MHATALALFLEFLSTSTAMCIAGAALFLIGGWAAKDDVASARGLDKIVALANLCYAVPLAVFGTLHFFDAQDLVTMVPRYMPGRMFWVYFVGCALIAAALSIATKIAVRWSGLLVGIMMFMFVGMLYLPFALQHMHAPNIRFTWTIVFRESSFGGAGWVLAGMAKDGWRGPANRGPQHAGFSRVGAVKTTLITVGRILIALAALFFGVQHFLHPMGLPGVPLRREMPAWVPLRALIDYVTGAALLAAGLSILLNWKARIVAAVAGGWILLTILVIYIPVMIGALANPNLAVKIEGINYFADTLFFAGVILAAASAAPRAAEVPERVQRTAGAEAAAKP